MSDEAMGDEVYQPDANDEQDASEGPDLENTSTSGIWTRPSTRATPRRRSPTA